MDYIICSNLVIPIIFLLVYDEGGKWLEKIDEVDVLNLDVDFDLKVNDNGKEFTCKVHAGPTSFIIENNELSVNNTYSITEAVV